MTLINVLETTAPIVLVVVAYCLLHANVRFVEVCGIGQVPL